MVMRGSPWFVLWVAAIACGSQTRTPAASMESGLTLDSGGDDGEGVGTAGGDGGEGAPTSGVSTAADGADGTGASAGTGPVPIKFDLPPLPDAGDGPQTQPTCDNLDDLGPTSIGCEFWAAAVPIADGLTPGLGWGISVGNPFDLEVTVRVEDMRGPGGTLRLVHEFVLAPQASEILDMNGSAGGLQPNEPHTVPASGLGNDFAFRVTSDSPVTAMQINPIGGAPSFVPDASMLLPRNSLGQAYYGLGYGISGWVIAIAIEDGTTLNTTAGTQTLDAFDTFTFATAEDPTGFFVGSDKPIAVFSGNGCTNVPATAFWCDHLEEAVIPLAAWGTAYVGARHPHREPELHPAPEEVYWRVVAGVDDVTITVDPPGTVPGDQIVLASAGEWAEFSTVESFVATSAEGQPFMLVQFMAGGSTVSNVSSCEPGPPVGDPYMMQIVPIAQWLSQLPFLTDGSYAMDFVTIAREVGTEVEIACAGVIDDAHFIEIPGTGYEVGTVELDVDHAGGEGNCVDGQQFAISDAPVGIMVGGYDCAASYGYPGGLSLDALWTPPTDPPE
jgi:hypothetical protein